MMPAVTDYFLSKRCLGMTGEQLNRQDGYSSCGLYALDAEVSEVLHEPLIGGKYQIERLLGHGSQGEVFQAKNMKTGEFVAIKRLRIDSVTTWKEYDLFSRESAVLASLDIDGVAHFVESFEDLESESPCAYIVQEYINGRSLESILSSGMILSRSRIFDIICQLANIIEKLHHHDPVVIHRDIKPGNVMICQNPDGTDKVYLIDFGAVANPQIQSGGSTVAGTFGYMPPEQLVGNPSRASDIYALGAMISGMLSGVSPADMQVIDFRLVIEPPLADEPPAVIAILRKMLEPHQENRLRDYSLIQRAFSLFKDGEYDIDIGDDSMVYGSGAYSNQLAHVKTLWQPGNYALWQALPDACPRKVPKYLDEFQPARLFDDHLISTTRMVYKTIEKVILLAAAVIFCIFCFSPESKAHVWFQVLMTITGKYILLVIFFIIFLIINDIRDVISAYKHVHGIINKNKDSESGYEMEAQICSEKLANLVQSGTKGIAIIENFEYVQAPGNDEPYDLNRDRCMMYCHDAPCFKITYRYRPAGETQDRISHVITHRSPFGKVEIGDRLPILYIGGECIPFPFAPVDITCLEDVCPLSALASESQADVHS